MRWMYTYTEEQIWWNMVMFFMQYEMVDGIELEREWEAMWCTQTQRCIKYTTFANGYDNSGKTLRQQRRPRRRRRRRRWGSFSVILRFCDDMTHTKRWNNSNNQQSDRHRERTALENAQALPKNIHPMSVFVERALSLAYAPTRPCVHNNSAHKIRHKTETHTHTLAESHHGKKRKKKRKIYYYIYQKFCAQASYSIHIFRVLSERELPNTYVSVYCSPLRLFFRFAAQHWKMALLSLGLWLGRRKKIRKKSADFRQFVW